MFYMINKIIILQTLQECNHFFKYNILSCYAHYSEGTYLIIKDNKLLGVFDIVDDINSVKLETARAKY
jgi:hypothetical protein